MVAVLIPVIVEGVAVAAEALAASKAAAAAAAAAATAVAFVAVKGREMARDAIDFFSEPSPLPPLPWIEAPTLRPLPWHHLPIPVFPATEVPDPASSRPDLTLLPKGGEVGSPIGPPPGPPNLGPIKDALAKAKTAVSRGVDTVTRHPLFKVYEYLTYAHGLGAIFFSTPDNGPLLYDYVWRRLLGLEDSAQVRTVFGLLEVVAAESTGGALAMSAVRRLTRGSPSKFAEMVRIHGLTFAQINGFAALGSSVFPTHQMTANDSSASSVDYTRAARTAFFYGATSILFFPLKDLIIARFGGAKFKNWWLKWGAAEAPRLTTRNWLGSADGFNWAYAQLWRGAEKLLGKTLLGKTVTAWIRPQFIPSAKTFFVYALFATAYRNLTQFVASLPFLEDSNWQQSLGVSNGRNLISIFSLDTRFYLGATSNSLASLLGNQLGFMTLVAGINQFYNAFDGEDISVDAADHNLREALNWGTERVAWAAKSKPLTSQNLLGEADFTLSVGNWTQLSQRYAQKSRLDPELLQTLHGAMAIHLASEDLGDRRVGMALGALLTQVALSSPRHRPLLDALQADGVSLHPSHAQRPLAMGELEQVFRDIDNGLYDETPLFQFPRI